MIVGLSGIADFRTITEALAYFGENPEVKRELILLEGTYEERLVIQIDNLSMIGIGNVQIVAGRYAQELDENGDMIGTFATPTVYIESENARFENITFVNNAGPGELVGQAVTVFVHADNVLFENCRFCGYQDTLCIGPLPDKQASGKDFPRKNSRRYFEQYRVLFNQCYIEGTIDYIFGGGNAIFHQCEIKSLARINPQDVGYVTAASTPKDKAYGFTFYQCWFTKEEGAQNVYLGRPWRQYAFTEMIDCSFDDHINYQGWSDWPQHTPTVDEVRYRETYSDSQWIKQVAYIRPRWVVVESRQWTLSELIEHRF
ncbi:pectin esterase [Aerococcaceae bacterium zg-ZUI334]|uniref:pectinesterase family protein n=1 Tax=Aerococcaceae bacterium zg-252 TaxID=2796928 RepID=UPI001B9260CE|nr:pectin esterase [Aerococcaceae bacterium zg-ZUI334]